MNPPIQMPKNRARKGRAPTTWFHPLVSWNSIGKAARLRYLREHKYVSMVRLFTSLSDCTVSSGAGKEGYTHRIPYTKLAYNAMRKQMGVINMRIGRFKNFSTISPTETFHSSCCA